MRRKFSLIVKRQKKRASQTDKDIDRHLMRRLVRLGLVKRFLAGWVVLVSLLIVAVAWQALALNSYYKETGPVPGGTFREGIVGQFRNANPIYADGTVDSSVSRLVFSGLLKYDKNQKLVGDLAERWEIDELEKKYTFHLRKDVKWHDEHPFNTSPPFS